MMLSLQKPIELRHNKVLWRYFFLSGTAVLIDVSLFQLFIHIGIHVLNANLCSSLIAVTFIYLSSAQYAFRQARSLSVFLLFMGYYALSIFCFSVLISYLAQCFPTLPPVSIKLATLPVSFLTNYTFASKIVTKTGRCKGCARKEVD